MPRLSVHSELTFSSFVILASSEKVMVVMNARYFFYFSSSSDVFQNGFMDMRFIVSNPNMVERKATPQLCSLHGSTINLRSSCPSLYRAAFKLELGDVGCVKKHY